MVKIILQPTGKDTITDAEDIMGNLDLAKYKRFLDKSEYIELKKNIQRWKSLLLEYHSW